VLLTGHPVAFALPQTVDALRVGAEALPAQEISDAAVAVTGCLRTSTSMRERSQGSSSGRRAW